MENCCEIQGIHRQITSIFHKPQQLLASKALFIRLMSDFSAETESLLQISPRQ
jgi:hypothetical protein